MQAALQAVLGAYLSDGDDDDKSDSSGVCTPPLPLLRDAPAPAAGEVAHHYRPDSAAQGDAEMEASMDLQKMLTQLRNKVEQERINVSSGSDIEEIESSIKDKRNDTLEKDKSSVRRRKNADDGDDGDVKVVTILDSDEEASLKKKKREERKTKKRKRSRYLIIYKVILLIASTMLEPYVF